MTSDDACEDRIGEPADTGVPRLPVGQTDVSATPVQHTPTPPDAAATASPPGKTITRTPLYEAMNAPRYSRQNLIREIEKETGTTLICYVSPIPLQIGRDDVVGMVDLLHNIPTGTAVDILLHSPGGDIDAAEKLITLVRRRAGTSAVRVIVPDYAKSAATLIALGADTIVMSDSSELGTIDPQVQLPDSQGRMSTVSAQSYLDAFHLHSKRLQEEPSDPVARLMLSKMEPVTVRKLERITRRSRSIAEDLLKQAMIKDETAADVAQHLSDTNRWHSHGQMIGHEVATGLGLRVMYRAPHDPLWIKYWRLYCLQLWATESKTKLFESSVASLSMA